MRNSSWEIRLCLTASLTPQSPSLREYLFTLSVWQWVRTTCFLFKVMQCVLKMTYVKSEFRFKSFF